MSDAAAQPCPDENALVGFVHRSVSPALRSTVERHLAGCDSCRAVVAHLANALPDVREDLEPTALTHPERRDESALASGAVVGRYRVEGRLGAGGMGVVYQASDMQLGRSVALKVLRGAAGDGRARLLREAQTMAKLSHPNVVALYELGTHEGQVFLAMELVRGRTLAQWLGEPRSTRDVLAVFRQAGLGLAAAHDAGLVHRDFKPANVLVSDDGRVRVTDFGLARATATPTPVGAVSTTDVSLGTLTQTGVVVGTPAYMAPEQLSGGPADPRTDQFAFCVSLYEALAGVRPFEGRTLGELHAAVMAEVIRAPASGRSIDAWLRKAVLRGLRPNPRDRYPSMQELLDALEEPARPRWPLVAVAGVVAVAALGGLVATRLAPAPAAPAEPVVTPQAFEPPSAPNGLVAATEATERPVAPAARLDPSSTDAGANMERPRSRTSASSSAARAALDAKSKKKSGEGLLSLHVAPWADVSVDGRTIGSANMMDYVVTLPAGRHEVTARHPQLGARTETVVIEPGKTVERRIRLR